MHILMVSVTIYFAGIAAIVDSPPHHSVDKTIIFPMAREGTYQGIELMPHSTFLYLHKTDYVATNPVTSCADDYWGTYDTGNDNCVIPLKGASVWIHTSDPLKTTKDFKNAPTFSKFCPNAPDLPAGYTSLTIDPDVVAARFDISGGQLDGCLRNDAYGPFITILTATSDDDILYLRREGKTFRVPLTGTPKILIENNATDKMTDPKAHFGWYYYMNRGHISCSINPPTKIDNVQVCSSTTGASTNVPVYLPMSVSGADCTNSNYP